jgi:uncharacterized protein YbaP (TraB family)
MRMRLLRLVSVALCAIGVAQPMTTAEAQPTCRGKDMLAEFATTQPAIHAEIMKTAAETANARAVFWRIEKTGVAPSHLFGTVHLTDDRITALSPAVSAALEQSKHVVLEVADLTQEAMVAAVGQLAPLFLNTSGARLEQVLDARQFATVKATLAKSGMPGEIANLIRPWLVTTLLSLSECERQRAASGRLVLDMRLAEAAKSRGIPVHGLETIRGQLEAMAAVPDAQQIEMLKASLKFADRIDDMMETMIGMYVRREMGAAWPLNLALGKIAGVSPSAYKGFENEIVIKRNIAMRDGALPLIEKGGAFIGVGALHLVGTSGLVELLRARGYTVTAIE